MQKAQPVLEKDGMTLIKKQHFDNAEDDGADDERGAETEVEIDDEQGHGIKGCPECQQAEHVALGPAFVLFFGEENPVDECIAGQFDGVIA